MEIRYIFSDVALVGLSIATVIVMGLLGSALLMLLAGYYIDYGVVKNVR